MAMFANMSYQEIHRKIILQIVYIRMQGFEVTFMYLLVLLQTCPKPINSFSEKSPFLAALIDSYKLPWIRIQ